MDQIRANTPVPIEANLMTELLSVQMSWGNGGCTRAGSPGNQQTRDFGPWDARRSRAMMRANAWGHDELIGTIASQKQQPHHCLLNRLFGCRSKKTSKLRVTGLCAGNSPGTGEFPAQMASNAENVSIWWRHHHITFLPGLHSRIWIWFQPYNMEEKHESHCWCWQDSSTQNAYFMLKQQ